MQQMCLLYINIVVHSNDTCSNWVTCRLNDYIILHNIFSLTVNKSHTVLKSYSRLQQMTMN